MIAWPCRSCGQTRVASQLLCVVPGGSVGALQWLIVIVADAVLSHNAHKAVDIVHKRIFVRSCEHMAQGDGEEAGCACV